MAQAWDGFLRIMGDAVSRGRKPGKPYARAREKAEAKKRQIEAGKTRGKGKKTGSGKLPEANGETTRDKVAAHLGWSGKTYEKANVTL